MKTEFKEIKKYSTYHSLSLSAQLNYRIFLLQEQHGKCYYCKDDITALIFVRHKVVVDHDHKTDLIRGITCNNCNNSGELRHYLP